LRVNIERGFDNKLIVDPLDSDRHFAIYGAGLDIQKLALDQTGAHAAMALEGKTLRVVRVDGSAAAADIEHGLPDPLVLLSFVDDRRVVVVSHNTRLQLVDWQAGQVVASSKLDHAWGIEGIAFHGEGSNKGVIGWRSGAPSEPIRLLPIENGQLGPVGVLARDQRPQWLDILELGDEEAGALFSMTESQADDRIDEYTSDRHGRLLYTEKDPRTPLVVREGTDQRTIALPAGQGRVLSASPDGSKIAIIQFRERDDSERIEDHLLSVVDIASGERLWTIGDPGSITAPAWSGDGKRIIVHHDILDAQTGETIASLDQRGLTIEERSDADWARQKDFPR
jgi:dipeptidyl aminopeptidase/acylaminoacyl peptidase